MEKTTPLFIKETVSLDRHDYLRPVKTWYFKKIIFESNFHRTAVFFFSNIPFNICINAVNVILSSYSFVKRPQKLLMKKKPDNSVFKYLKFAYVQGRCKHWFLEICPLISHSKSYIGRIDCSYVLTILLLLRLLVVFFLRY